MASTYVEYVRLLPGLNGLYWLAGCVACRTVEGPFEDPDDAGDWADPHRCHTGGGR
jgi:hypothetical protein